MLKVGLRIIISIVGVIGLALLVPFINAQLSPKFQKGYDIHIVRDDDTYFTFNGDVIVGSTVIDYKLIDEYVVGLKMPISFQSCGPKRSSRIRIKNERFYFVLSMSEKQVRYFPSKEVFLYELHKLGIESAVSELDYTKFNSMWSRYSARYEITDDWVCKEFPPGNVEYEKMHK